MPSVGTGNDGDEGTNQQTSQCTTGRTVDMVVGLADYGSTVGVCTVKSTYDPVGNLLRQYLPTSDGSDNRYLEYSYTGDNLVRTVTAPDPDGSGRVTAATNRFDGPGRITRVEDALGHVAQTTYTADGLVAQTTGQAYTHDSVTVTEIVAFRYDAGGNQTVVTNPKGDDTTQAWTTDGLLASIAAPGPSGGTTATTRYTYDKVGNQTRIRMPKDGTEVVNEFTRDNLLLASHTSVTANSYRSVRYSYSPAGLKIATETARCATSNPDACQPGASEWHSAGTMRINYGPNGRVADQVGRDAGPARAITTTYTQDGHPKTIADNVSAVTTTVGYYLDSRVRTVDESGVVGGNANTYAYDAAGQVTVRSDETGASGVTGGAKATTSYAYGQSGLPTAMTSDVLNATTDYTFDAAGRLTSAATGSHLNEWSWHPNNALAGAKTTDGATVISQYVYGYDNNRNIAKQTASGEIGGSVSTYSYAPGEQLTKAVYDPAAGETITKDWTYDRNSNRLTETVQQGAGPAGTTTWTYRLDNSIGTQDGPVSGTGDLLNYQYNDRGLLTNDGCATTSYDVFDRTTSVVVNNTAECGGDDKTSTYTYDGLDRQRSAQVAGADEGNTTTRSAYDGLSSTVVGQVDAVNGTHSDPTVLYQLDPAGDAIAYEQTVAAGGKAFLDTDGHGNVTAITTNSGALGCAVVYDPDGSPLDPATGADANGVCKSGGQSDTTGNAAWYRGLVRDGTTGTYQLGTRTYDPSTGAFTSPDAYRVSSPSTDLSVGVDPLTANTYVYVNGNPLNFWDPNGHLGIPGWDDVEDAWGDVTESVEESWAWEHKEAIAEVAGYVPVIGDAVDVISVAAYAFNGDWTNAGISAIAIIPVVGSPVKSLLKHGDEAYDFARRQFDDPPKAKPEKPTTKDKQDGKNEPDESAPDPDGSGGNGGSQSSKTDQNPNRTNADKGDNNASQSVPTNRTPKADDVAAGTEAYVYRGVSRKSPAYGDALEGNAVPRNVNGSTTAEAHNFGNPNDLADSPFTSWSRDPAIAQRHAGDDGVILRLPTGKPPAGSSWKFEWSPDVWFEQEVLVRGPVYGAERIR